MPALRDHPRISVDADTCFGRPRITGTRVRVMDVLEMLGAGASDAEILADYPYLAAEDIKAALRFAAAQSDRTIIAAE